MTYEVRCNGVEKPSTNDLDTAYHCVNKLRRDLKDVKTRHVIALYKHGLTVSSWTVN